MSQPYYQQPSYPPNYGAYGPPPPQKSGPNWILIILGIFGGGAILLVVACCGSLVWIATPPKASPQASQPFEVASVPIPPLPPRGGNKEAIEPGVVREEVSLGPGDGFYNPPGHGGILWIYLPEGNHAPGSLPCVLICGAGSTLLEGMSLVDEDSDEHVPYARAGFAVVAYELDGPSDYGEPESRSYNAFKSSRAGLVNARNALEYALAKVPEVNPRQIYSAGHSSAGTLAILFAEHEPRLAGCVAYAPCVDVPGFLGAEVRVLSWELPQLADFAVQSSPKTHESRLNCPLFLFHAEGDENVDVDESRAFADRLKGAGKDVTIVTVSGGDHYESMIEQGIPKGIEWLKTKTGKQ